ncbi:MAG TPA: site-specific integrase [Thermodesulfobacteriota bacterium]
MAKRRAWGTGSIYKRGKSWYIAYYADGKQIREKIGSTALITKGQAEQALKARMGEVVQDRFNLKSKRPAIGFEKLVEKYLDYSKANHRSYKRSVTICKALLRFFKGHSIDDITSWSVEQFKAKRKDEGKTLGNINRELTVLKRMFNLAIEWGLASANPVKGVKFFKVSNQRMQILREEDFLRLYEVAAPHLKPILICAVSTGMRRSEILGLKWEDVNLKQRTITVRDTKNFEFRFIPINETLLQTLTELQENASSEYVFNYKGSPVKEIKSAFETALNKAKISRCRFHDLRHTIATRLVMNGVDLVTVQELLGHRSIVMTKRYSHPTPEHKKRAIESVNFAPNKPYMNTSHLVRAKLLND